MKLTKNMIRNVMGLFLTLRDQANAEGLTQAAANADKGYRNYRELLYQTDGKRPSGVGAGQPSETFLFTIKTRLPLIGGECNGEAAIIPDSMAAESRLTAAAARAVPATGGSH